MNLEVLAMAVALGTDAFSVAVILGIQQFNINEISRISGVTGLFHIFMPLLGYYGGNLIKDLVAEYLNFNGQLDYIFSLVGAGILMLLGLYMIIENWLDNKQEISDINLNAWGTIALAVSVSIDALSVGISLGMLNFNISVVLVFGIVAGLMMGSGLYLGSKVGHWLGDNAQVWGGLGLIYLGFHFAGLV